MPIQSGRSARRARGHRSGRAASAESGAAGEGSEVCKQYGGASAALRANFGLFFRARAIADRGGAARAHRGPGPRRSSLPAPAAVSSSASRDEKTCKEAKGRKEGEGKKKKKSRLVTGPASARRPAPLLLCIRKPCAPGSLRPQPQLGAGPQPPASPPAGLSACPPRPRWGWGACDYPRYPKDAEVTGSLGTWVRVVLTRVGGWGRIFYFYDRALAEGTFKETRDLRFMTVLIKWPLGL